MIKYAKIVDENTGLCEVGIGTNVDFYRSIGMTEMDVEQGWDNNWYLAGFMPVPPAPTIDEQKAKRAAAYLVEVDPITAHIQRLRDDEEPDEQRIAELIEERNQNVQKIKELYPYPEVEGGE